MRFLGVSIFALLALAASGAHAADATAKLEITGHVSPKCAVARFGSRAISRSK